MPSSIISATSSSRRNTSISSSSFQMTPIAMPTPVYTPTSTQVPTPCPLRPGLGIITTPIQPVPQSTVLSDSDRTFVDSPVWDPKAFPFPTPEKATVESVASILNLHEKDLLWITPKANARWDMPAGRQSSSAGSDAASIAPTTPTPTNPTPKPSPRRLESGRFRSSRDKSLSSYGYTAGWKKHIGPDGKPFFIKDSGDPLFITDTFLDRPSLLADIERWCQVLRHVVQAQRCEGQDCPARWEVYLRVEQEGGPCYYYMVDHDYGQVFWAHEVERMHLGLDDCIPDSGVELFLESEFWAHLELFGHTLPAGAEELLRGMLVYAHVDSATAPGSTSLYSPDECSRFLEDLDRLSASPTEAIVKNHFIARLTKSFSYNRYLHYYGEEGARVDLNQPSHADEHDTTWLVVRAVLFLLHLSVFGLVSRQMDKIKEVVVGDVLVAHRWKSFLAAFVKSVDQSNIVAAIILASNIGFLAINTLDVFQASSSLISAVFSLTSLLIGLHHVRQHNSLLDTFAHTGACYFKKAYYRHLGGYRLLAFFLCLPFALLVWSILTFCLSIALLAYQMVGTSVGFPIFLVAGAIELLLLAVTVWFFWKIWEPVEEEKGRPWLVEGYDSFREKVDYFRGRVRRSKAEGQRASPILPK